MRKKRISITEGQLRNIIRESLEDMDDIEMQKRVMYANYGNKSQYKEDPYYEYDNEPGELAMDALGEPYDPDYVDDFDPEMTPYRGNDPEYWKSVPKGYDATVNEGRLRRIVKESVRRVLSENWEDDYNAAMDKVDYNRQKSEFDGYPWYKRLLKRVMMQNPKDPNPKKTADELASQYVRSFNQEHGMGERTDYPNGESFHSGMNYQKGNYRPVMSATYFDGNGGYGERKAYNDNGDEEEWGIAYPYSEIGITGRPDDAAKKSQYDSDDVERRYRKYDDARQEIGNVMKNRNNRKQGGK